MNSLQIEQVHPDKLFQSYEPGMGKEQPPKPEKISIVPADISDESRLIQALPTAAAVNSFYCICSMNHR